MVDTPMSPPPEERGTTYEPYPVDIQGTDTQKSLETVTNHYQGMGIDAYSQLLRL